MNKDTQNLLNAIAFKDMRTIKKTALDIAEKDNSEKNRYFCNSIINSLKPSIAFCELPSNVKDILIMEDVSITFNANRYFLSSREMSLFNEIQSIYETNTQLEKMGINYLNSTMLYGESGVGKTLFGKYVAYRLGLPFVYINLSNIISSYLGNTAKNINRAFLFTEQTKCVFMIDEIDSIGIKRGENKETGEMSRVVIALMQALDCVNNDTIIIGATNRLDIIDKALLRRFNTKHKVEKLNNDEMEMMIARFMDDVNIQYHIQDIKRFCENNQCSQSEVMSKVVEGIVKSIQSKQKFQLKAEVVEKICENYEIDLVEIDKEEPNEE